MQNEQGNIKTYDIVIIGGGISGLGIAWQAALDGHSVLLLEKDEIAKQASSNSLRIIHGGLRYLQQLNIKRVLDSAKEQSDLSELSPELIKPLWCAMPLNKWGLKSRLPMRCAIIFYNILRVLAGASYYNSGKIESKEWADSTLPIIKDEAPKGVFVWRDAYMPNDLEFAYFIARQAHEAKAIIREHTEVKEFVKLKSREYQVVYSHKGNDYAVKAKYLINASGAWLQRFPNKSLFPKIKWCKAFNIVISRKVLDEYAVGVNGDLGRVFFLSPREKNTAGEEGTAIGTFYYMFDGNPDEAQVTEAEIEESLERVNKAFPQLNVKRNEVIKTELGILPARGEDSKGPILYGSEQFKKKGHYIEILSTKFTTFRSQARNVLRLCNF